MTSRVEVLVATFGDEEQAAVVLNDFRTMDRDRSIELIDAAAIVRGADGTVRLDEPSDVGARTWAKRGAIAGGLVGLIFPPSILATALAGAAGGGVWGKVRDTGIPDSELERIGQSLEPGSSAVIAVADGPVIERLQARIDDYRRIATHTISDEASAAIVAEADEADSRRDGA